MLLATVYRSDKRNLDEIKQDGGFKAWVELSVDQARWIIERCDGKRVDGLDEAVDKFGKPLFPQAAAKRYIVDSVGTLIKKGKPCNLHDLAFHIKTHLDRSTFQVSTDETEACGGQLKDYIYEIQFKPELCVYADDTSSVKPAIILDNQNIDHATVIGLRCHGEKEKLEFAFLTSIPYSRITRYKCVKAGAETVWEDTEKKS
jgi:hypothetical protein